MNSFFANLKSLWRSVFHREEVFTERATIRSGVTINHEKVAFSGTDKLKHALVNALLMFCLTAGTTAAFASAFEIEYNAVVLFALYVGFALIFSLMNCKRSWQNIGYILFFFLFTFFLIRYRLYVNSGLNGFLNDFFEHLSDIWNMEVTKTYNEQFEDMHYMTITMLFFTVGVAVMLMINFVFNNEQSPLTVFIIISPFLGFALYFDAIPGAFSFILIAFALICCSVLRHNHQFTLPTKKKSVARFHRKHTHMYVHYSSGRVVAQMAAVVLGFILIFASIVGLLYPSDSYTPSSSLSALKDETESDVRQILLYGFRSYLESDTSGVGGLNAGRLGTTATVTNDYATDLVVTFAPYSYDAVYLKSWVGTTYTGNSWENVLSNSYYDENGELVSEDLDAEATMLSELLGTDSSVLRGKMTVELADPFLSNTLFRYPYYTLFNSDDYNTKSTMDRVPYYYGINTTQEYEYYVYQDIWDSDYADLPITTAYDKYVNENYVSVFGTIGTTTSSVLTYEEFQTDENDVEGQLKTLCEEQGFGGTTAEVISQIQDFLEENYTYSLNPGKLPDGEDFVTYFLFENPYGYCSYFATAGTLLLRSMGIPARYVEGYVITMSDIVDSTILEDENYEDWLEGDAEIGQTAVVQAEIDDSKAHAWCEVYLNGYGWVPVEFTVSGTEDEEDTDYWNLWSNLMSSTADDDGNDAFAAIMNTNVGPALNIIGRFLLAAIIIVAVILALRYYRNYQAALAGKRSFYSGYNAKVLKQYQKLCKLTKKKGLSDTDNLTITELVGILKGAGINPDALTRMKDIYQTAAYSPESISEETYKEWREICANICSDVSSL